MILILTTIQKKEAAVKIGQDLLKKRLIACYNLFPIESGFWWKGKITNESEILMILKTKAEHFEKIEGFIKENSGYEIPEVVSIKPEKVHEPYLKWFESEISD